MSEPRCQDCGCLIAMHFSDGCHRAFGFICRCPRTAVELEVSDAVA